jgi:hypothetical protein
MLPVDPAVAELIVALTLVRIAEDFVCLSAFLKLNLRLGLAIPVIAVGVVFHGQAAIGALDLLLAGGASDTQNFVIIAFNCRHGVFYTSCGAMGSPPESGE